MARSAPVLSVTTVRSPGGPPWDANEAGETGGRLALRIPQGHRGGIRAITTDFVLYLVTQRSAKYTAAAHLEMICTDAPSNYSYLPDVDRGGDELLSQHRRLSETKFWSAEPYRRRAQCGLCGFVLTGGACT